MTKCLLLLALFFCLAVGNGIAQADCSSHYFETSFYRDGNSYHPSLTLLSGGNIIMASYANTFTFNLVKIDPGGDTLWNKSYRVNGGSRDGWEQTTRLDIDGTLLCALSGDQLVKIDTNGVVIWAKHVQFKYGIEELYDIQILQNGDKLLFYQATDDGRSLMARVSPDLETERWCKYFYFYYGTYTNVVVDGDQIVFGGAASEQDYSFNLYPFIASVDLNSGNLKTFRFYKPDFTSTLRSLYKCGDGYLALASLNYPGGNNGYVRFNKDLSLQSAVQFQGLGINDFPQTQFSFAPQPDGSFYMAYGGFFDLSLSYITNGNTIVYIKDIPGFFSYPSDLKQSQDGLYITGSDNFYNVATQTTGSNTYVVKCDFAGSSGDCEPEQAPTFVLQSVYMPEGEQTMDISDSSMTILPIEAVADVPIPLSAGVSCTKDITCNSVHIEGPDSMCSTTPVHFTGSRNKDCRALINWSCTAPSDSYTLTAETDSTVAASFSRDGVYTLYARLEVYCGAEITDSLKVSVNLSKQLNLGNDTFLCHNHIVLNAGDQFSSYRWQDNSTGPAYTVSQAGTYFVTAADHCGNTLSDTVVVSTSPSYFFSAGNDTLACSGDTLMLKATPGFDHYHWLTDYNIASANDNSVKVFPLHDTSYIVQAEKPAGCLVSDTVQISVHTPPPIHLGNDTSFCKGESMLLQAGNGFEKYQWSTGETEETITVRVAGVYTVQAENGSCFSQDTLVVTSVFPTPETGLSDTALCVNSFLVLRPAAEAASYTWQDGSHLSQYTVTEPGVYWVDVKDVHGCLASDTLTVSGPVALPDHFLPGDTVKCSYDTLVIQPLSLFKNYLWSDGSKANRLVVTNTGSYWLQVTDGHGCVNRNYITVGGKECKNEIYFPSAFTPNGDGHNDVFRPKVLGSLEQFHLAVYNRWGQKVYESEDWKKGWDGRTSAAFPDSDTYVWIATYKLKNMPATVTKGTVVLLK